MAETTTLKTLREAVAGQLGLLMDVIIDSVADPVCTIGSLADKSPDAERMRDAYLYQGGVWRRILSFNYPTTNEVTLSRPSAFTGGAAQVYSMLDPDDMNAAINEVLRELYYVEKDTIALVADTKVYALPAWIQQKGQVLSVKWRDISGLSTRPLEQSVGSYSLSEDANTVTLYINDALQSITTYDIQVSGRRNYSPLANDAATTTCPYNLVFAAAQVSILHKIFSKYGKGIATLYGPKMQVAEREMAKAKADWLPKLVAREYVEEEYWEGVDGNPAFDNPPW